MKREDQLAIRSKFPPPPRTNEEAYKRACQVAGEVADRLEAAREERRKQGEAQSCGAGNTQQTP